MYNFAQFDPRPQGAAANNGIIGAANDGANLLGIEVTIPQLAERCKLGNLDHHGPGSTAETPSAAEQALTATLPADGATLATIRCDADSITAMAVLASRAAGRSVDEGLVSAVGRMDRLGPSAGERDPRVVAIGLKAGDFKSPLEARVAWVQSVLDGSHDEAEIVRLVAQRDAEFAAARAASEVNLAADGRVAVVKSSHRYATNLGYEMAQIVVASNEAMPVDPRDPSKGTYRKHTVCRYDSHTPIDMVGVKAELTKLEPGWGGLADLVGSPQGVSSRLTTEEVVAVVAKYLK